MATPFVKEKSIIGFVGQSLPLGPRLKGAVEPSKTKTLAFNTF